MDTQKIVDNIIGKKIKKVRKFSELSKNMQNIKIKEKIINSMIKQKLYHGTTDKNAQIIIQKGFSYNVYEGQQRGISITSNKEIAKKFAYGYEISEHRGTILEVSFKYKPKIYIPSTPEEFMHEFDFQNEIADQRLKGYDVIYVPSNRDEKELRVINLDILKINKIEDL